MTRISPRSAGTRRTSQHLLNGEGSPPVRRRVFGAPSMDALLWVKVPSRVDHNERSEAQLHEGDRVWGGSVERSCGPMNKNRIEGGADQGERARNREALVAAPKLAEILVKIKPTSLLLTLATQVQRTVD